MQKTLFLVLSLLCFIFSKAQLKVVGESLPFDEQAGFGKLLQLKNGNTFFMRFTEKDGIYIRPYDAKHKEGAEVHIDPLYKKLEQVFIQGVFEVGGDVVVFAGDYRNDERLLYRMIIDGKSGKLKEDKVLFTMAKLSRKDTEALGEGAPFPFYVINKDPYSENYAIALQNTFAADKNQRLELYHYGADNNVISHVYCKPQGEYKYMSFKNLEVIGKEAVYVIVGGFNNGLDGTAGSEIALEAITSGGTKTTLLDVAQNATSVGSMLQYNPVTKKIITVLSVKKLKKDKDNVHYLCNIDPSLNKVESPAVITPTAALAKSADLFKDKKGFSGSPKSICINQDGSFAIISEETASEVVTSSSGHSVPTTTLGNIAVSMYTGAGAEIGSYLVPQAHFLRGLYDVVFYVAGRDGLPLDMDLGNHFRSFAYLTNGKGTYIIFNDLKENEERVSQGKRPETVSSVTDCDAYVYTIEGKNIMPARKYLFGEPAKSVHNLGAFMISDYDRDSNMLVTMKLNMDGKRKTVNLVWLQPS